MTLRVGSKTSTRHGQERRCFWKPSVGPPRISADGNAGTGGQHLDRYNLESYGLGEQSWHEICVQVPCTRTL